MAARVTKDFNKDIGGTVDDSGTVREAGDGIDEAVELQDRFDFIKRAEVSAGNGKEVEDTDAGGGLTVGDVALGTDFSGMGHRSINEADGSGKEELVAVLSGGEVVTGGCGCVG